MSFFGDSHSRYVCYKPKAVSQEKNCIPTVKHGSENLYLKWGCFSASEPLKLAVIKLTLHSASYQSVHDENVRSSVKKVEVEPATL